MRDTNERSPAPDAPSADQADLLALTAKINDLLPPQYENCFEEVKPASMGSAAVKFGRDGRVTWDDIWTTFCDLALAGGPPHRGRFLAPAFSEEVFANEEKYQAVVEEIGRGVWLTTGLPVLPRIKPGWVGVRCRSEAMAAWLVRAIVVENVLARREQITLYLPAGPHFRLEKEIKNVIVALAKTCHYWTDHMPAAQRGWAAGNDSAGATVQGPASPEEVQTEQERYTTVAAEMERRVRQASGLAVFPSPYPGWVGVRCTGEEMAVWLVRALVVENVLARREDDVLYLPVSLDAEAEKAPGLLARAKQLFAVWVAGKQRLQG